MIIELLTTVWFIGLIVYCIKTKAVEIGDCVTVDADALKKCALWPYYYGKDVVKIIRTK